MVKILLYLFLQNDCGLFPFISIICFCEWLKLLSWGHIKYLSWVEVKTLPEPLQDVCFLLVTPFCCWLTSVLWVLILLHNPAWTITFSLAMSWLICNSFFRSVITCCSNLQTTQQSQSITALSLYLLRCFDVWCALCF